MYRRQQEDMQSLELNSFLRRLTRTMNVPDRSLWCYTCHCGFRTSRVLQIISRSTVFVGSFPKQLHLYSETSPSFHHLPFPLPSGQLLDV